MTYNEVMPGPSEPSRRVYLDHAATAPLREEALEAMLPLLAGGFGNPSSLHEEGRRAREVLEAARDALRAACGARDHDLYFTSGGTEADNAALVGSVLAARAAAGRRHARPHVVTTAVEHSAVLEAIPIVEALGGAATVVEVDGDGRVDPARIEDAIRPETILVSVLAAQNEVGTLEPFQEVGEAARRLGVAFHTDAVQLVGKAPLDLGSLAADLVTVSSHKVGGPKGIAGLFVRRGTPLEGWIRGGAQEGGLRAGTESVAAAAGFARAVELACREAADLAPRLRALRDRIRSSIRSRFPGGRINTPEDGSLPNILNVSFPRVEGESLVKLLDILGVSASTGSACNVGARKPSHVLRAMGRSDVEIRGSVRFSLGRSSTEADVDLLLERLEAAVERLEKIAPAAVPRTGPPPAAARAGASIHEAER